MIINTLTLAHQKVLRCKYCRCVCQARSQVSKFGGKIHFGGGNIFVFITGICLKQIFWSQHNLGGTAPKCPPWLRAWCVSMYMAAVSKHYPYNHNVLRRQLSQKLERTRQFLLWKKNTWILNTTIYWKELFHSQESDTVILSEYVFRLLRRYHQILVKRIFQRRVIVRNL